MKHGFEPMSVDRFEREIRQLYISQAEVDTVVGLLQARGLVQRLEPTNSLALVLLRPELLNQYASSIIQAARTHPQGIGAILERDVLNGNLPLVGFQRPQISEEKPVIESTAELLVRHDLCFREMGLLVFPSQINVTRPAPPDTHPRSEVTYEFSGGLEAIYASLVVRLSYTGEFQREVQWKYAAEFSKTGHRLGFAMCETAEGTAELEVYFYPEVSELDRVIFTRFITDHLRAKGIDIHERIRLYCRCGEEVENRNPIEACVRAGKLHIPCQYCGASIIIPRSIEERYRSDRSYLERQRELAQTVEQRTEREVQGFQADRKQYTEQKQGTAVYVLHFSDFHLESSSQVQTYRTQLESDLAKELKVSRLMYLAVSGDIANYSSKEEYEAAFELIDGLVKRFGLDPNRVIIAPGNHDVNWELSKQAYEFTYKPTRRETPC